MAAFRRRTTFAAPFVLTVDDTFEAPNLTRQCGFSVETHLSGTFTFKVLQNGIELDRLGRRGVARAVERARTERSHGN